MRAYSRIKWREICYRGNTADGSRTSCAATAFGHRVQQKDWDHVARLAPLGWKEQNGIEKQEDDNNNESCNEDNVSSNKNALSEARKCPWGAKRPERGSSPRIYEVDLPHMDVPMQAGTGRAGACRLSVLNAALKCV